MEKTITNTLLSVVLVLLGVSLFQACSDEPDTFYGTATAKIISVERHDVVGSDIETTVIFEDGQVESFWRTLGDEQDVLFFPRVKMKASDSTITYIPISAPIKNVTKGYETYGEENRD